MQHTAKTKRALACLHSIIDNNFEVETFAVNPPHDRPVVERCARITDTATGYRAWSMHSRNLEGNVIAAAALLVYAEQIHCGAWTSPMDGLFGIEVLR
jgi:hypothetical protein